MQVRDNQLIGLRPRWSGLQNTGDTLRQHALHRAGHPIDARPDGHQCAQRPAALVGGRAAEPAHHAAHPQRRKPVIVTADLPPPSSSNGSRIDVGVSSLGDATSLMGGTLILTSLNGGIDVADLCVIAQGAISVSGFGGGRAGGNPYPGRADGGPPHFFEWRPHRARDPQPHARIRAARCCSCANADFSTSVRVATTPSTISATASTGCGSPASRITAPSRSSGRRASARTRFMAEIGELTVQPDHAGACGRRRADRDHRHRAGRDDFNRRRDTKAA